MNAIEVGNRLRAGAVYLMEDLEGVAIRNKPGTTEFFARFPGEQEYSIHYGTKIVTNALLAWTEITKTEYEKY